MEASALAAALIDTRREDGAFSLRELQRWLASAGLEELARTVSTLHQRLRASDRNASDDPGYAWF